MKFIKGEDGIDILELTPEEHRINEDWPKQRWDLPAYKSEKFFAHLRSVGLTLEEFKELPVYQFAVKRGLIVNDEWAGTDKDSVDW